MGASPEDDAVAGGGDIGCGFAVADREVDLAVVDDQPGGGLLLGDSASRGGVAAVVREATRFSCSRTCPTRRTTSRRCRCGRSKARSSSEALPCVCRTEASAGVRGQLVVVCLLPGARRGSRRCRAWRSFRSRRCRGNPLRCRSGRWTCRRLWADSMREAMSRPRRRRSTRRYSLFCIL